MSKPGLGQIRLVKQWRNTLPHILVLAPPGYDIFSVEPGELRYEMAHDFEPVSQLTHDVCRISGEPAPQGPQLLSIAIFFHPEGSQVWPPFGALHDPTEVFGGTSSELAAVWTTTLELARDRLHAKGLVRRYRGFGEKDAAQAFPHLLVKWDELLGIPEMRRKSHQ